jgi:hypothetical protein
MRRKAQPNPFVPPDNLDLFSGFGTTRAFRPLSEVPEEQLLQLDPEHFTDVEWEEIGPDLRRKIKGEKEVQARIDRFVEEFKKRHNWAVEPGDMDEDEHAIDWLGQAVEERPDERLVKQALLSPGGKEFQQEIAENYDWDAAEALLPGLLRDLDNYTLSHGTSEYGNCFVKYPYSTSIYMDRQELDELLEDMDDEEIEEAIDEVNSATYLNLAPRDLDRKHGLEIYDYDTHYIDIDVDWDKIRAALESVLEGLVEEEASIPITDRIVYQFSDGAYIVELLPGELKHEGKELGHCVGRADMGYASAICKREIKIYSLRTANGRSKFTFEVALDKRGRPSVIEQVKGKANRLPGFDRGQTTGKVKADEVHKIIEFVESIGMDPRGVDDLDPAMKALGLSDDGPEENPRRHAKSCPACAGQQTGFCAPRRAAA